MFSGSSLHVRGHDHEASRRSELQHLLAFQRRRILRQRDRLQLDLQLELERERERPGSRRPASRSQRANGLHLLQLRSRFRDSAFAHSRILRSGKMTLNFLSNKFTITLFKCKKLCYRWLYNDALA
jgi:hypothetical protein